MVNIDELEERVVKLEGGFGKRVGTIVQYLLSPLILLIIGFVLNQSVEEAKQEFQKVEIEVKRIEAAQDMLSELFSGVPERAFIADRLIGNLVDEELAAEISDIVTRYYSQKFDRPLNDQAFAEVAAVIAAAESIGGTAADSIRQQLTEKRFAVVIASLPATDLERAKRLATDLNRQGYPAEVRKSTNGLLAVSVGQLQLSEARILQLSVVEKGDGPEDTYVAPLARLNEQIYKPVTPQP